MQIRLSAVALAGGYQPLDNCIWIACNSSKPNISNPLFTRLLIETFSKKKEEVEAVNDAAFERPNPSVSGAQ